MTKLDFEDLHEGQKLTSPGVAMTQADILAFAREFDPQPMHVDPHWAAASPLGGLIASGWHTASVAIKLQQEAGLPAVGLAEIASLAWPLPVRPGDQIHAEIEIKAVESSASHPGHGLVHFQNTALNGRGETVQIITGSILVPLRTIGGMKSGVA